MTAPIRTPVDFGLLVNEEADNFETEHETTVRPNARQILIGRALPHQRSVERELATGTLTEEFLRRCIRDQLQVAHKVAQEWGRAAIGEDVTEESMKRKCVYAFWC